MPDTVSLTFTVLSSDTKLRQTKNHDPVPLRFSLETCYMKL